MGNNEKRKWSRVLIEVGYYIAICVGDFFSSLDKVFIFPFPLTFQLFDYIQFSLYRGNIAR
jgi:hypothetical protein